MYKTTQLVKVLDNTSKQELNNKLNNYFQKHLRSLGGLLHDVRNYNHTFEFDVVYNNDCKVWNPIENLQAYAANYNIKDKYIYKNYFGLYSSCNKLKDIYTEPAIERIARELAYLLKGNDYKDLINALKISDQRLLQKILKISK